MTTTASIATKGTKDTGITETLASKLHDNLGKKLLCVVELVAETRTEKRNGDEKVVLSILTIEPAPNNDTEDHLRELARSFHYERRVEIEGGQAHIPGTEIEPKVTEVLAAGAKHRPHPYLASTLSTDDNAVCDVCGTIETMPVHTDGARLADPFTVNVNDEDLDDEGTDSDLEDEDEDDSEDQGEDQDPNDFY